MKQQVRVISGLLGLCGALAALLPAPARAEAVPLEERLLLCGSCHNPDGNSIIPENPKLSGLSAGYIERQLKDFKSGKRSNPVMDTIIPMVDESEFNALATYFSGQKREAGVAERPDLVERGRQIFSEGVIGSAVPACTGCHNVDALEAYPRLNGQNAAYVRAQLANFKGGARKNDAKSVMRAVAKRMNDEEIEAVAEYLVTLKEYPQ